MIAILAVWRYGFRGQPFTYDPLYWGAVFPLGMYAVGTFEMERAMDFGFLDPIPQVFFAIALAAWLATAVGLVRSNRRSPESPSG
jgi:tellurite resistance protein TehA-like permease